VNCPRHAPGKPYFSKQAKLSKLDIVRYYLSVAPGALAAFAIVPSFSSAS
jgi:bifunctional non-homologous end joining protein LigD